MKHWLVANGIYMQIASLMLDKSFSMQSHYPVVCGLQVTILGEEVLAFHVEQLEFVQIQQSLLTCNITCSTIGCE